MSSLGAAAHFRIAAAALILVLTLAGVPARAEDGTRVTVRVIDQLSKRGLALARVILTGPVQRLGFTDESGSVDFVDLVAGDYQLAASAPGHRTQMSNIRVADGISVAALAGLAPNDAPKIIGRVSVKQKRALDIADYKADGAIRRTTDRLDDALRIDPAAVVGRNGAIAIDGQGSAATAATLDGIPLSGAGFDARRLSADLFSSLSVAPGPANGATAGSVDVRSFDPTILFRSAFTAQRGSDGGERLAAVLTGTSGNVGYAASVARALSTGPLNGQRFLDAGGDFVHADNVASSGVLTKFRLGLSPSSSVVLTALHSAGTSDDSCAILDGARPCTFGPGAADTNRIDLAGLTFTGVYGKLSLTATPYARHTHAAIAYPGEVDAGIANPQFGSLDSSTAGVRFAAELAGSDVVDYHLNGIVFRSSSDTRSLQPGPDADLQAAHAFADVGLGASAKLRPTLSVTPSLRFMRTDSTAQFGTDVALRWTPARDDALDLSYAPRRYGTGLTNPQSLSAPWALDFNCAGHTAIAQAAGEPANAPATSAVRLKWVHEHRTVKTIVSAFRAKQVNASIPAFVDLPGLGAGLVPPGYLAAANAAFTSPYVCPGSAPLNATDVAVSEPVTLPAETTLGVSVAAALQVHSSLILVPSLSATYAHADSLDAPFSVPRSTMIAGQQIPGVPMHRWSLLADYRRPGSRFEAIASLTHTSANNPYFLPAYTMVGAGVSLPLGRGADLVISGTNLTNAFGGSFASPALGVPLAVNRGKPLAVPGYPLPARRIGAAVRFALGSTALRAADTIAPLSAPSDDGTVVRFNLEALPDAPPDTPAIDVDPAAPSCVPESLRDARRILKTIGDYAARLDAGGDPAREPFPPLDGVRATLHTLGGAYELRFAMNPRATLAVARCGAFSYATREEVSRIGLEDRSDLAAWQLDFRYVRRFGLFQVERPDNIAARAAPARSALPQTPPDDPFVPVSGPACGRTDTGVAGALLARLRPAIDRAPAADPAFTVARHDTPAETWYSVELRDPLLVTPLLNCAAIASASRAELQRRGLDGLSLPAINYAKRVGWYVVARAPERN